MGSNPSSRCCTMWTRLFLHCGRPGNRPRAVAIIPATHTCSDNCSPNTVRAIPKRNETRNDLPVKQTSLGWMRPFADSFLFCPSPLLRRHSFVLPFVSLYRHCGFLWHVGQP